MAKNTLILAPTRIGVGLTSVAMGLQRALENKGVRLTLMKAINFQAHEDDDFLLESKQAHGVPIQRAEYLISQGQQDQLLEELLHLHSECQKKADVIIVLGLVATSAYTFAEQLNAVLAKALDAKVILVTTPGNRPPAELEKSLRIAARAYGGMSHHRLLGAIINKIGAPFDSKGNTRFDLMDPKTVDQTLQSYLDSLQQLSLFTPQFALLGKIPWKTELIAPRVKDILHLLDLNVINAGDLEHRRITRITLCARNVSHIMDALQPGTLIVTAIDRIDILISTCMAALNGVQIGAIVLAGDGSLNDEIMEFCYQAMESGLPILQSQHDTLRTAMQLDSINLFKVPADDIERIEAVKDFAARRIDADHIETIIAADSPRRLSPPAFRYQLVQKAQQTKRRIVLPEGDEPRTIEAAAICHRRDLAHCVLLGDPENIQRVATQHGLQIPKTLEIINPQTISQNYVASMVKLRKAKGMTELIAKEQLKDNIVLGTMMLANDDVDGLVSGAISTTANTIRPALQLIKTAPDAKLVSSIFFMCLPEQVLVFGDCAVNPDPNTEELADIAIQSADSAKMFDIPPRIAMISYSTGSSGRGANVDKVRQATELVKQQRPDLIVDGPLQYDAALIDTVARSKAPGSPVAGKATVFIFPDLNTGNTTYKAVQRSANVLCIGPMLQGLGKPVNDLSRGASVDDIVYTIIITAIQAAR